MKIAFANLTPLKYDPETVYQEPLGGSESSLCYLSAELAKLGHEVTLFTHLRKASFSLGVSCIPFSKISNSLLESIDVLVIQNTPIAGLKFKPLLKQKAKLVFWTGHAADQPAVQCLRDTNLTQAYDAIVMVSDWQLEKYKQVFKIKTKKLKVLKNAMAPTFENLFTNKNDILSAKTWPPTLAYTSTPFRGLDILLEIFPAIRQSIPEAKLKVFSGMAVYQKSKKEDEDDFGWLYRRCQEMEGAEYLGSLPQPKLAQELKSVSVWAYPNTFPETSCIAAMEAMASGCQIVTSKLGALPETTTGFAQLIPISDDKQAYQKKFTDKVISCLEKPNLNKKKTEQSLIRQVKYANKNYAWTNRAQEWDKWFRKLGQAAL